MSITLAISPAGQLLLVPATDDSARELDAATAKRISGAFAISAAQGFLHLATIELQSKLPPEFAFVRDLGRDYLTRLCHVPEWDSGGVAKPLAPPAREELAMMTLRAPPMRGLEYLTADVLATWWADLDSLVRREAAAFPGGVSAYLRDKSPLWRFVGRVTLHLAENKRDRDFPFAFLATFASRLSQQAKVQHLPLGRALQEYAGAQNRDKLVVLLSPVRQAAEHSELVKELVDSGEIYHPLAWTPQQAHRFLQAVPALEESGLIVRVPDWWSAQRPPRPVVSVKIGGGKNAQIGVDDLLDFRVGVALEGEQLTEAELKSLLESSVGLVNLRGRWVEVDRDKLSEALQHWKKAEQAARDGLTFFEGMRLLSGLALPSDSAGGEALAAAREWTGLFAGTALQETLRQLTDPEAKGRAAPPGLRAELRPYQATGVHWLRFMSRLGLGACLADDMGLGKTIQVIAMLLHLQRDAKSQSSPPAPSLLVVPASLVGNWMAEIERFAPSLTVRIAHPSEFSADGILTAKSPPEKELAEELAGCDLVITTYSMLTRIDWLRKRRWNVAVLDEAQAIKNSATRQTRAVKELTAASRVALTGTPVENRLSDLWSLFDFLNPGLLGGAKEFTSLVKKMSGDTVRGYGPLRSLVHPYLLRRLKTDKSVIADLPEKAEVNAYCSLTKRQAALYEQTVRELESAVRTAEGIQRRGIVLASLMRFKQICNHPSQLAGDNDYAPELSGKFERLGELCGELAERQQKALVFTQFREITGPLNEYLATVFGRPGLVLHGETPVKKRRELVEQFQRADGPPFFVLSLKAGGTGLNLTEASHVIHFDRWWNPAVENQATDRAFRIGQKRNVLVHKFVCRGTVEEKIDALIAQKTNLAEGVLGGGGETLLTEMSNDELLQYVSLDIRTALAN